MNDNKEEIKMDELDGIVGGTKTATLTPYKTDEGKDAYHVSITGVPGTVASIDLPAAKLGDYQKRHSDWTFKMNQ